MRKLVTIRKVKEIIPIDGADKIELAIVDGWKCVVGKGDFKVDDLGLYFEVDALLPLEERYGFLHKTSYRKNELQEGFRLKTMKFKGVLSQGLLMPMDRFPELDNLCPDELVNDHSEALGVQLWCPPIPSCLNGVAKGGFPSFVHKTDQDRIQNMPFLFNECKGVMFEGSEKLDGTSATYYLNGNDFGVCGKNLEYLPFGANTYCKIAEEYGIEQAMRAARDMCVHGNFAIQGEIFGEGIGGDAGRNPLRIHGQQFRMFNVFSIDLMQDLSFDEDSGIVAGLLHFQRPDVRKLEWVPIIEKACIFDVHDMDSLIKFSAGRSTINPDRKREDIVWRSPRHSSKYGNVVTTFKVLNNEYLLDDKS